MGFRTAMGLHCTYIDFTYSAQKLSLQLELDGLCDLLKYAVEHWHF